MICLRCIWFVAVRLIFAGDGDLGHGQHVRKGGEHAEGWNATMIEGSISLPATLEIARFRFTLCIREAVYLPLFKGSALRGGLGHALRRIACSQGTSGNCDHCKQSDECVYGYLFCTSPPGGAQVLRNQTEVARPYVIEPPLTRQAQFIVGDWLSFDIILVGRGITYLPYFIVAVQGFGRAGLGRTRGRFTLERVTAVVPEGEAPVLDAAEGVVHSPKVSVIAPMVPALKDIEDKMVVTFLAPTRLKHDGRWVRHGPPFHVLIKALLGRVSALSYFHGGERWEIDFRGWIDRAQEVRLANGGAGWEDWARYSGRQHQRVQMGGLVGPATYEGDLAPFLPLLALGEWIHVGKGTVFGNGRYEIRQGDGAVL